MDLQRVPVWGRKMFNVKFLKISNRTVTRREVADGRRLLGLGILVSKDSLITTKLFPIITKSILSGCHNIFAFALLGVICLL